MIGLIICILIMGIFWGYLCYKDTFSIPLASMIGITLGILGGSLIWFMVSLPISSIATVESYIVEEKPIVSLTEISNITDESGYVRQSISENNQISYYFMTKENGIYAAKTTDSQTQIIESNKEKPRYQKIDKRYANPVLDWLFMDGGDTTDIIIIPKGTLISTPD